MKPKLSLQPKALVAIAAGLAVVAAAVAWLALRPGSSGRDTNAQDGGAASARAGQRGQSGASASDSANEPPPFPYDTEYPAVGYRTAQPTARAARLAADLEHGTAGLTYEPGRGYLDSLLAALDIDASSQVLVFSRTSLQAGYITPKTPRAIYFNDDTYVAWEQGAPLIEIASMDPDLGAVFYALRQSRVVNVRIPRETTRCLRCHDTYELTGGGVPRFLLGSGYIGADGQLVSHEGWILTTDATPLESRWGGWYVTGEPDRAVHLGNLVVHDPAALQHLDTLRVGTLRRLDSLLDTGPYLKPTSDIVALLVLQHQAEVQNRLVRASFEARQALSEAHATDGPLPAATQKVIDDVTEPLVDAMLFVGAAPVDGPLSGSSGFRKHFEAEGPRDARGRSLRDLDLKTRLFRYPMSYLIYSPAFDALPAPVKTRAYRRFAEVLSGADASAAFAGLGAEERAAILEILEATEPDFEAAYRSFARLKTEPAI